MNKENPLAGDTISVNIKKHKVSVTNEKIISIHCPKSCKKPCEFTTDIVNYLEAELFVKEGYVVSNI